MRPRYLLVITLLASLAVSAIMRGQGGRELTGQVVAVMDGDMVGLLVDRQEF